MRGMATCLPDSMYSHGLLEQKYKLKLILNVKRYSSEVKKEDVLI
jgi:hypothetical protein